MFHMKFSHSPYAMGPRSFAVWAWNPLDMHILPLSVWFPQHPLHSGAVQSTTIFSVETLRTVLEFLETLNVLSTTISYYKPSKRTPIWGQTFHIFLGGSNPTLLFGSVLWNSELHMPNCGTTTKYSCFLLVGL